MSLEQAEPRSFLFDCDAILFDLDGVLVDSRQCVEKLWVDWAEHRGIDPGLVLCDLHGKRAVETVRRVAPHLDADAEAAELAETEAGLTQGLAQIPGAADLLRSIPMGDWAIATSGSRATATTRLNFGRLPFPAALVSSEDVGKGKPDPEPYLLAAKKLGVDPTRCVVVEDAPAGIQAGKAGGMRVVAVLSSIFSARELGQADAMVLHLGDLEVLLSPSGGKARLWLRGKCI